MAYQGCRNRWILPSRLGEHGVSLKNMGNTGNMENMEKMENMEMFSGSPTEMFSGSPTDISLVLGEHDPGSAQNWQKLLLLPCSVVWSKETALFHLIGRQNLQTRTQYDLELQRKSYNKWHYVTCRIIGGEESEKHAFPWIVRIINGISYFFEIMILQC